MRRMMLAPQCVFGLDGGHGPDGQAGRGQARARSAGTRRRHGRAFRCRRPAHRGRTARGAASGGGSVSQREHQCGRRCSPPGPTGSSVGLPGSMRTPWPAGRKRVRLVPRDRPSGLLAVGTRGLRCGRAGSSGFSGPARQPGTSGFFAGGPRQLAGCGRSAGPRRSARSHGHERRRRPRPPRCDRCTGVPRRHRGPGLTGRSRFARPPGHHWTTGFPGRGGPARSAGTGRAGGINGSNRDAGSSGCNRVAGRCRSRGSPGLPG